MARAWCGCFVQSTSMQRMMWSIELGRRERGDESDDSQASTERLRRRVPAGVG